MDLTPADCIEALGKSCGQVQVLKDIFANAVAGRRSVLVSLRPKLIARTGSGLSVNFRLGAKLVTAQLGGRSDTASDRIGLDVATDTLRFFDVQTGLLVA
jgi:hypothetical protein